MSVSQTPNKRDSAKFYIIRVKCTCVTYMRYFINRCSYIIKLRYNRSFARENIWNISLSSRWNTNNFDSRTNRTHARSADKITLSIDQLIPADTKSNPECVARQKLHTPSCFLSLPHQQSRAHAHAHTSIGSASFDRLRNLIIIVTAHSVRQSRFSPSPGACRFTPAIPVR